jgi:circadian clock protein KaiB
MQRFRFTLYVAGDTLRSARAAENLERLANEHLGGDAQISVVDVTADPGRAEAERILTTPTLVKEAPEPARRVTGDLGNLALVAAALGLQTKYTADGK